MEMESKARNGGLEGKKEGEASRKGWPVNMVVLRLLALLLTLTAAIVLGLDKQSKLVAVSISPDLPTFNVPVTAKFKHASAFVYFVVVNSIASASAAASLALTVVGKGGGRGGGSLATMMILMDLIMLALLFSGIGAAGAVGMLGQNGNSHLHWNKVCNVFGKFCHQVIASLGLSLLGAVMYFLVVALSFQKLQKRS